MVSKLDTFRDRALAVDYGKVFEAVVDVATNISEKGPHVVSAVGMAAFRWFDSIRQVREIVQKDIPIVVDKTLEVIDRRAEQILAGRIPQVQEGLHEVGGVVVHRIQQVRDTAVEGTLQDVNNHFGIPILTAIQNHMHLGFCKLLIVASVICKIASLWLTYCAPKDLELAAKLSVIAYGLFLAIVADFGIALFSAFDAKRFKKIK